MSLFLSVLKLINQNFKGNELHVYKAKYHDHALKQSKDLGEVISNVSLTQTGMHKQHLIQKLFPVEEKKLLTQR